LLVALAAALVFFFLSFKKNTSAAVCGLTKTMTKKVRATAQSSTAFGAAAVPRGVGLGCFGEKDFYFLMLGFSLL
jgi:hypothetical protein